MRNVLREEKTSKIDLLFAVVTMAEISYHWGKHRSTIYSAIDRGHILARSGKNGWLIDIKSVISYWGQPKIPISYEVNFP
jgi:hypothetical protein